MMVMHSVCDRIMFPSCDDECKIRNEKSFFLHKLRRYFELCLLDPGQMRLCVGVGKMTVTNSRLIDSESNDSLIEGLLREEY